MQAWFQTRTLLSALLLAGTLAVFLAGSRWLDFRREHRYDPLIRAAAARYEADPALVSAVIWRESGYHAGRTGKAGEIGLMQVREAAGREWAKSAGVPEFRAGDLFDPGTNILAGTWYLSRALRRWSDRDNPASFALAEYNAGLTHARRWAAEPGAETAAGFCEAVTFPSTRAYIRDVLTRYREKR